MSNNIVIIPNATNQLRDATLTIIIVLVVILIIFLLIFYFTSLSKKGKKVSFGAALLIAFLILIIVIGLTLGWIYLLTRQTPKTGDQGQPCSHSDDCQEGFYCSGNNTCQPGTFIVVNSPCSNSNQCLIGNLCIKSHCEARGKKIGDMGEDCITTADCQKGHLCLQGTCSDSSLAGKPISSFTNATISTTINTLKYYLIIDDRLRESVWTTAIPNSMFNWNASTGILTYGDETVYTMSNGQLGLGPAAKYQFVENDNRNIFITDRYKNTLDVISKVAANGSRIAQFVNSSDYESSGNNKGKVAYVKINEI